jgi:hypothetical protein
MVGSRFVVLIISKLREGIGVIGVLLRCILLFLSGVAYGI